MSKFYIMYDGRAMYDTDAASVLEAIGPRNQIKSSWPMWHDTDAVLVEYDCDEAHNLTNEVVIGHVNEGFDAIMQRIPRERRSGCATEQRT